MRAELLVVAGRRRGLPAGSESWRGGGLEIKEIAVRLKTSADVGKWRRRYAAEGLTVCTTNPAPARRVKSAIAIAEAVRLTLEETIAGRDPLEPSRWRSKRPRPHRIWRAFGLQASLGDLQAVERSLLRGGSATSSVCIWRRRIALELCASSRPQHVRTAA